MDSTKQKTKHLQMTKLEAAWLAGFIDGEGTFTIMQSHKYKNYPYYTRIFAITNTNKKALQRIVDWFGGKVKPKTKNLPRRKPQFYVTYAAARCFQVIKATLPYLTIKREVAEAVLNFPKRRNMRSKDPSLSQSVPDFESMKIQAKAFKNVRKLNKRGI